MVSSPTKEWLVLLATGKVLGPLSTIELMRAIRSKQVGGDEKIKHLNRGTWFPISQEPMFFDQLLEMLVAHNSSAPPFAGQADGARPQEAEPPSQETVFYRDKSPSAESDQTVVDVSNQKKLSLPNLAAPSTGRGAHAPAPLAPPSPPEDTFVIEARSSKPLAKPKKSVFIFGFLLTATVGLAAIFLLIPDGGIQQSRKMHLLRVQVGTEAPPVKPTAQLNEELKKVLGTYQGSTYSASMATQSALVSMIEQAPQFNAARGFLCLVYRDLWSYVEQDRQDQETLTELVKTTRNQDPAGSYGAYCEVSRLLLFGKSAEARGVLDFNLNQPMFATDPVLILMKAEVLSFDQDFLSAKLFSETARKIWPQWIKPILFDAEEAMKIGKKPEALHIFEEALKIYPSHPDALVQVGALNWEISHDEKKSQDLLTVAIQNKDLKSRPLQGLAYYTLAEISDAQGNRSDAIKKAEQAYQAQPSKAAYRDLLIRLGGDPGQQKFSKERHELILLGDEYRRSGDCFSAQAEYRAAFDLNEDSGIAAAKTAQCMWELNQGQEALKWAKKAITADPDFVQAYTTYADFLAQRFQFQEAFAILGSAVRKFPNNSEVLRSLGLFEYRRQNDKEAINYLTRALKQDEQDIETLILLAQTNLHLKEYAKAQSFAVRALELEGTSAESIAIYAENLSAFKGLDAAVFYLKDQISKYAQSITLRLGLAQIYFENEKFKEAEAIYRQIIAAQPKNKKAQLGLADSLKGQARYEQAVPEYLNTSLIDPTDPEPYFKLGILFLDENKPSLALAQFKNTEQRNSLYPRLYSLMGRAALENQDTGQALAYIEKEKANNPNLAESYLLAAEIYDKRSEFQKCAGEYQHAVRLRPQGASIYVKMAKCYRLGGAEDVAESMLNVAASIESGLPDIYKEQGLIFEQRGDGRAAQVAFEKYLGLSPNAPDKILIEEKIQQLSH